MITLVSSLILICSFYAFGIFYALSLMEKNVWGLMIDSDSRQVEDSEVERIQAVLQSVVHYLPPTMKVLMGSLLILLGIQVWIYGLSVLPIVILSVFAVALLVGIPQVLSSINDVETTKIAESNTAIRKEVSKVLLVHHGGLFVTLVIGILQTILIVMNV